MSHICVSKEKKTLNTITTKSVTVDRLERKPCCSLIRELLMIDYSLEFIIFVIILVIINITEIGW